MAECDGREQLRRLISQWNENRLELFGLSEPTEDLEFYGVMRFYYQEEGSKVVTKCIRVSSQATASAVVEALMEKFHPDMKMLTVAEQFSVWEVHENGEERRLAPNERPLLVQLSWHKDDREGRFLLRSELESQYLPLSFDSSSKRRFSKRTTKQAPKYDEICKHLFTALPTNNFTRTISNPEAVMKKRRERRLENKFREIENGANGGSLKIYGGELVPNRPYVTLLVSEADSAFKVVSDALEKYNLENENARDFVLVEVTFVADDGFVNRSLSDLKTVGQRGERLMMDDESPLQCLVRNAHQRGLHSAFILRQRPPNFPSQTSLPLIADPMLVPLDGSGGVKSLLLDGGANELGSDFSIRGFLLRSPHILPRHCVFTYSDMIVTLSPLDVNAAVEVNGQLITRPVILNIGDLIRIGGYFEFRLAGREVDQMSPRLMPYNYSSPSAMRHEYDDQNTGLLDTFVWILGIQFLNAFILNSRPEDFEFPLYPAFRCYLHCRTLLRNNGVESFVAEMVHLIRRVVGMDAYGLTLTAFWMANLSEFIHLEQSDRDLSLVISHQLQDQLLETLERCFELHVESCVAEIQKQMPTFVDLSNVNGVIRILTEICAIVRQTRLNAAIIVRIFSHLFHFINMYSFNWLVSPAGNGHIHRSFAEQFRDRLHSLCHWAERQGLIFAAELHLDRILRAVDLLLTPKTMDNIASLGATCYKLNSVQVRFLLEYYIPDQNEPPISVDLIENVGHLARLQADKTAIEDRVEICLEESPRLDLPFVLPQEGYTIENMSLIPEDMHNLILGLIQNGILSAPNEKRPLPPLPNPTTNQPKAEVLRVTIERSPTTGVGLTIVAVRPSNDRALGIYVRKVVENSAAAKSGLLETGDQLLSVNGFSLINVSQETAAKRISESGTIVRFDVAKHAAAHNGLDVWFSKANISSNPAPSVVSDYVTNRSRVEPVDGHVRSSSTSELYQHMDNYSTVSSKTVPSSSPSAPKQPTQPVAPQSNLRGSSTSFLREKTFQKPGPSSGRRSAPLFGDTSSPNTQSSDTDRHSKSLIPSLPMTEKTSRLLERHQEHVLPFLAEMGSRFNESKAANPLPKARDEFTAEIEALENSIDKNGDVHNDEVSSIRLNPPPVMDENGHTSTSSSSQSPASSRTEESNSEFNERNQSAGGTMERVVGLREVYNDPRQKRLNEIKQKPTASNVDGANLGFRDKMRIFAAQIGEQTPKSRHSTSSAQRVIENEASPSNGT